MRDFNIFIEHDLFFSNRDELKINPRIIDVFKALQISHVFIILADNNPVFTDEEFSLLDKKLGINVDVLLNKEFCKLKELNGDLLISQNPALQEIAREKKLELAYPAKAGMFRLQDIIKVANEMANAVLDGKKILFKYDFDNTMVVSKHGELILNDFFIDCVADFHVEFDSKHIQSGILSARAPDHEFIERNEPKFYLISYHLPNFLEKLNEKLALRANKPVKIDNEKDITCLMDHTKETTHIFLSFVNTAKQLCFSPGKESYFDCGSTVEIDINLASIQMQSLFGGETDPSQYTKFQHKLLKGVSTLFYPQHQEQLSRWIKSGHIFPQIDTKSVLRKADVMKACVENENGNALCVLFDDSENEIKHITGRGCMSIQCYLEPAEEIAFESTKFLLSITAELRKTSKVTELLKKPLLDYSFFQKKPAMGNQQQRKLRAHSAPARMKRVQ